MLTTEFRMQEIPLFDPIDQGDGGDWETVGEPAERSRNRTRTCVAIDTAVDYSCRAAGTGCREQYGAGRDCCC
jgi:hypothetical protein